MPVDIGFSTSDFQDNGPKIHPNTNWSDFYNDKKAEDFSESDLTPNIWHEPNKVIEILNKPSFMI